MNHPDAAHQALVAAGYTVHPHPEGISLPAAEDVAVAAAVRALVKAEVDVYAVEREQESLEDTFLALTEGKSVESWTEIAAGGGHHA
ncbi:hypothetical protein GCM10025857_33430 [Alicyclobacillus contaminans]|nr:hypothetical protein GCM10025857_33430 [Alicyclobacillus contaminans]